jgi:hypothetical protein
MRDDWTAESSRVRLQRFWKNLLNLLTENDLHYGHNSPLVSWLAAGAGHGGLSFRYVARQHEWWVELYIGKDKPEDNKRIFDRFEKRKAQIEQDFGCPFEWQRYDDGKASQITSRVAAGGHRSDERDWPTLHQAMIDAMRRLIPALSKHFRKCV